MHIHETTINPVVCAFVAELSLIDPAAITEYLRGRTDAWRERLAEAYVSWLQEHMPEHLSASCQPEDVARNWTAAVDGATRHGRSLCRRAEPGSAEPWCRHGHGTGRID